MVIYGTESCVGGVLILGQLRTAPGCTISMEPLHAIGPMRTHSSSHASACCSIGIGLLMGCLHFFTDPPFIELYPQSSPICSTPPTFGLYLGLLTTNHSRGCARQIQWWPTTIHPYAHTFAVQVPAVMCGIGITYSPTSRAHHRRPFG